MEDDFDISNLKKKKRVNSRTKGSTFERNICKLLNERFSTTEFSRSPGSGAFATTHSLPEHLKIYGDLITPEKFKFCIECKKGYNHLNLYSLYNYSSEFWKFIEQCEKDSKKCNRTPLVIFKQDRQPTLAIIPDTVEVLSDAKYIQIRNRKPYRMYLFEELIKCWDSMWFD
jgi:hypothetical protein